MIKNREYFEIYEGFVSGELAARLFQRASIIALPYISASTSGVLMTAYLFGKPVIAKKFISTSVIVNRIDAGEDIKDVADDYDLDTQDIDDAIIYERAA